MTVSITLGTTTIDNNSEPYIIADIGVNHECSLDKAKRLIDLAKEGGAHAAKFQSYKAGKLASRHSPAYWDTTKEPCLNQFDLFKKYDAFNIEDYIALAAHCQNTGIDFTSTPFDLETLEALADTLPYFKIASADITNIPLLRKAASYGKPVILSTGAATLSEIDIAVSELRNAECKSMALLHCVLNYPTPHENAYLDQITHLKRFYPEHVTGYSDHVFSDDNMDALITAYILGARILEKHFTHDKSLQGNDHYHAMDKDDLKRFHERLKIIRTMMGPEGVIKPAPSETKARRFARRSIVLTQDLKEGSALTESAIICKRPGTGVSPLHWDEILGRTINRDLEADHVLTWADLSDIAE